MGNATHHHKHCGGLFEPECPAPKPQPSITYAPHISGGGSIHIGGMSTSGDLKVAGNANTNGLKDGTYKGPVKIGGAGHTGIVSVAHNATNTANLTTIKAAKVIPVKAAAIILL